MADEAYDRFTQAIIDLAEVTSNTAYEKLRNELAKLNGSWASDAFIRALPKMIGGSFADIGKVTFSAVGLSSADLIPIDFELPDTTDMVTVESDACEAGGADGGFDLNPPFEIELIVRDLVDGQDVVLSLAPKPNMSPLEAFWLSAFARHYDNYGDDAASGSVVEWLRKHDLLRHFETA